MKANEYRKSLIKAVKAPSGFEFKIRKLTTLRFASIGGPELASDPARAEEFMDAVIKACVVEPKIVDEVRDPEAELGIDEIAYGDKIFLLNEILAFSGLRELGRFREGG